MAVWENMQKYLYLPRLKDRPVFEQALLNGASTTDFFGTASGETGDRLEGFRLGDGRVQLDDTLLLVEPGAARIYQQAQSRPPEPEAEEPVQAIPPAFQGPADGGFVTTNPPMPYLSSGSPGRPAEPAPTTFFGSVDVSAASARMKLLTLADEVISLLASDPNATVKVTVEIRAEFPGGVRDSIRRAVTENATQLGFTMRDWE